MARSRKSRARRTTRSTPAKRSVPATDNEAERRLLALARELAALGAEALPRAVDLLAGAYAPEAPLPRAVRHAWLAGRGDKTATLALAWAREQVRLALEERLIRAPALGAAAADPATRAWLLLAAAESIAHEPPAAVADRLRALLEFTGQAPTPV